MYKSRSIFSVEGFSLGIYEKESDEDLEVLACVPLVKHGRSEGYNILFSTPATEDFDRYVKI